MNYSLKVSKSVDLQVVPSVFPPHLTLPPSIDSRHPLCVRHCRVLGMSRWMRQPWTLLSQSPALKGLVPSPQALKMQCERCIQRGGSQFCGGTVRCSQSRPTQPGMSGNRASTRMREPGAQTTPLKEALTLGCQPCTCPTLRVSTSLYGVS